MSEFDEPVISVGRYNTEYRDNYGYPKYGQDRFFRQGYNTTDARNNPPPILTRRGYTGSWDPNNPKGLPRPLPLAPFIPDPLPYPEPVEPYPEMTRPYDWPMLGPWLPYLGPLGSSMVLSPTPTPYVGFDRSQEWEKLLYTPSPRHPALLPTERRVDGTRSWTDATSLDGRTACDGLCPWCGSTSPRQRTKDW